MYIESAPPLMFRRPQFVRYHRFILMILETSTDVANSRWYFCTETSHDVIIFIFLVWATLLPLAAPPPRRLQQFFDTTVFHTRTAVPVSVNLAAIFSEMLAAVTGFIDTELFTRDQLKGGVSNH